ncbi:MAG: rRNA methyltransferase [Clostridiales bacterium]|nr:rRNA methyltransferase [Clostridiales bacterium]
MNTLIPRATEMSHILLALVAGPGDTVIDATAGWGRDTCFLAALVGETGQVWSFDIQEQACLATAEALLRQGLSAQVRVVCDDHANIADYNIPQVKAAVFNLGWLPGSDHSVVSGGSGVILAMEAVLDKLKIGGIIVVVTYPGHAAGAEETAALRNWVAKLPAARAQTMQITFPSKELAPLVIVIEKADQPAHIIVEE